MAEIILSPEQEADVQRMAAIVTKKAQEEVVYMLRLLASKPDAELLGASEFEIRDRAHKIAAQAIETVLNERKKRGTEGRA